MSVAAPKAQAKEPIQIDVILICRKQELDFRHAVAASDAFSVGVERAIAKAKRLQGAGIDLSRNDKRVLLIGQFLVEICAGREALEVAKAVTDHSEKLNLAVSSLSAVRSSIRYDESSSTDPQLVLLEQAAKLFAA
jgi:hypothetical protein